MTTRAAWTLTMAAGLAAGLARGETVHLGFYSDDELTLVERRAPGGSALRSAIGLLVDGPTEAERLAGISSEIPAGTSVVRVDVSVDAVRIDLSPAVLAGLDEAALLGMFNQFRATLNDFPQIASIRLTCSGLPLARYLPPPPEIEPRPPAEGAVPNVALAGTALSGRNITIGPSHGRFWNGSGWYWQRSDPCGFGEAVLEDTNSIRLMQFLYQYLVQDGAVVHVPRELNESNCCHSATGLHWWKMAARYWLQANGLPSSVWDSSTTDLNDDIRCRPLFADYRGSDIYLACHTNAGGGGTANGTETYRDTQMEHPAHEAASLNLANNVQSSVVSAIREMYDAAWSNRGVKDSAGGFGEIRIPNRPAILIELAFHDNCSRDALYLTDNFFRSVAEWGFYRGVCQYFGVSPTWDRYSDEYVGDTIPASMTAGQSYPVSVTFRNRGVVWSEARAFRLGAVGDSDPFTTTTRHTISGEVRPGSTCTFNFTLTAPGGSGTYTTDWRMVRDGVAWFGAACSKQVQVGGGGPQPPTITQHPSNQAVPAGGTGTFSVAAVGDAPLYYRWQKDGSDMNDGGKVSGSASSTLQIANVDASDQAGYRCVITNAYGSATSNSAGLTIAASAFVVESRSGGQNHAKYSETGTWADTTGKSTASGVTGGIGSRYGSSYRSVAGEKHAFFDADLPVNGTYEVFVTWGANANRRSPILHRITHVGGTTDINVDQASAANDWVSLGTYSFNGGSNVGRVDVNNLNIDVSGSMYADAVKWVYLPVPVITQQPSAQVACPGGMAQFTVAAAGGSLSYRWQKNASNLSDGGHYSGAGSDTLTVSDADSGDVADYRCVVTNVAGSTTSGQAPLTLGAATTIIQHPESQTVCAPPGTSVQFTVAAAGQGTMSYQWQKNGIDLLLGSRYHGVTGTTLTVVDVTVIDSGNYWCVVTAGCGSVNSDTATLTVRPTVAADLDHDCDVDPADLAGFQACMGPPDAPPASGCESTDLDGDNDVDQSDFGSFQRCLSGVNVDPDPDCGT